jgi:dihydropteroate synthase
VPTPVLTLRDRSLLVDGTLVMGVVNASPESFSDAGRYDTLEAQCRQATKLIDDGADIIDIGGQSAITGEDELSDVEESDRVVPIVEWVSRTRPEVIISVDTYKPAVVRDVLAAGAHLINDVSGLLYPDTARLCAAAGAGLVIMHTKARPKQRLQEPDTYADVTGEVVAFLELKIAEALSLGVRRESLILDPGPDFAKMPHQTITMLRDADAFRVFGRPLLLALSRKDFLGAIVGKSPRGREAATIAAIAHMIATPGNIVRVHDVDAARDAIAVIDVLTGRHDIPRDYRLADELRHEPRGSQPTPTQRRL